MDIRHIKQNLLAHSTVLRKRIKLENEKFAKFVEDYLRQALMKTLMHHSFGNPRGRLPGFSGARPNIKTKITQDSSGDYHIEVIAFMSVMGTGVRHKVWHIIENGRKPYKAKKWQRFPLRFDVRTTPNSYEVKPFAGWSGEWASIAPGKTVGGFEGRNFYQAIVNDLIKEIGRKYPTYKQVKAKTIK